MERTRIREGTATRTENSSQIERCQRTTGCCVDHVAAKLAAPSQIEGLQGVASRAQEAGQPGSGHSCRILSHREGGERRESGERLQPGVAEVRALDEINALQLHTVAKAGPELNGRLPQTQDAGAVGT